MDPFVMVSRDEWVSLPRVMVGRPDGEIDRVTQTPGVVSRAPCRITTLVNRAPILTDTHQQHTLKHLDRTRLTLTHQLPSLDTAQRGPITPTCHPNIAQLRPRPFPERRRPTMPLRALPIVGLASRPPTRLRLTQTQ